jgi:hypothetical protein
VRKWIFRTFILSSAFCSLGFTNNIIYSLADLETLEKEKNSAEFLQHARDIKPHLRNRHYQDMLENMAILHLKNLILKKSSNTNDFNFIEEIAKWPTLEKDAFFQSKRNTYMANFFSNCFTKEKRKHSQTGSQYQASQCQENLHSYWNNSSKNPDLGLEFALYLSSENGHLLKHWDFIQSATLSKVSEFLCKKDIVLQYAKLKISHINLRFPNHDKQFLREVDRSFNWDCLAQLYPLLKQAIKLADQAHPDIFRLLNLNKKISVKEKNLYYLDIFLSNPPASKEFNVAWNTITRLGQNYAERQRILNELKKRDLLPGKLFSSKKDIKSSTMTKLIYQNFPEYLDLYSKTCVSYMAGDKVYALGNPTPYCKNLFKSYAKLLDRGLISRYRDIILKTNPKI